MPRLSSIWTLRLDRQPALRFRPSNRCPKKNPPRHRLRNDISCPGTIRIVMASAVPYHVIDRHLPSQIPHLYNNCTIIPSFAIAIRFHFCPQSVWQIASFTMTNAGTFTSPCCQRVNQASTCHWEQASSDALAACAMAARSSMMGLAVGGRP